MNIFSISLFSFLLGEVLTGETEIREIFVYTTNCILHSLILIFDEQ